MTPVLVATTHGQGVIPPVAFEKLKEICSKLYGDAYCLAPSPPEDPHFMVKVIKLTPEELT